MTPDTRKLLWDTLALVLFAIGAYCFLVIASV